MGLVSALNTYLCTEFVNEMNLSFQRFMSGFYQINFAVTRPTEFNLEQNLHPSGKFGFSAAESNFNCDGRQYSLDGNISAESFPSFPEIFFVKDCIDEITHFGAAVK